MSVTPTDSSTRSFIYRELIALDATFEDIGGCAAALTCGGTVAAETEQAASLGLCDLSALPRSGYKGWNSVPWVVKGGAKVGDAPNRAYPQKDGTLFGRLAVGEVLILGPLNGKPGLIQSLAKGWSMSGGEGAYPVPRQHTNCWYGVSGEHAAGMFAKICGVDLRPKTFENHGIAQTSIAKLIGIIVRDDLGAVPNYHLLSDSASAAYLWTCLLDAAEEFGGRPVGLSALRYLAGGKKR